MFSPIMLCGKFTTTIDVDNDQINEDVMKRSMMKLDDNPGNTLSEDSYYPETEACNDLLIKVDKVIQNNINRYFRTYNSWAHILQPNESTMIHSHDNPTAPPGLSWVYYSKTDDKCGNIVWSSTIHNKFFAIEETPKVGMLIIFPNWMPHFTKKNNSNNIRISISGNAQPDQKDFAAVGQNPEGLFNIVGVTA